MTNEEKIRKMSRWELAEFIYKITNHDVEITTCKKECEKCECSDYWCISGIGEWLMRGTE